MPIIGEVKNGREIGRNDFKAKYIWSACADCGKEQWVACRNGEPRNRVCFTCLVHARGEKSRSWKGGRAKETNGYVRIWVSDDDFFRPMANKWNYVLEHRLVMAKHLGRNLHIWELVHHQNHIRDDNRLGNLQLISDDRHKQITILENKITTLEKRVTLLEAENVLLRTREGVL